MVFQQILFISLLWTGILIPCIAARFQSDYEVQLSSWVKNITASSTCGYKATPEEFCLWTKAGRKGFRCLTCDSRKDELAHDIVYALEDSDNWWKSENGQSKITININLGQEFFITGIILKMGPTPRPSRWILERSSDSGETYHPWQYFESSSRNCRYFHNIEPNSSISSGDQILCKASDISKIEHEEQFYTLQGISIFGRCVCYGHDEGCEHDNATGRMVCKCEHNTCGPQCNVCCPGFNQRQWHPVSKLEPHSKCQECNCFGHAKDCYYNSTVNELKLSLDINGSYAGGRVCINCKDNTAGINCDQCEDGFYRTGHLNYDNCQECNCDLVGSVSFACNKVGGQCRCKNKQIGGQNCDRCIPGHWGFPDCQPCNCSSDGAYAIGTCNETNGQCLCKIGTGTVGKFCDMGPTYDRHLMTSQGCIECDPCSLLLYRSEVELQQFVNESSLDLYVSWPSTSWVELRIQWIKGIKQNLENIWNIEYTSQLNSSWPSENQQLLHRRDALKLNAYFMTNATQQLSRNLKWINSTLQGTVDKLRYTSHIHSNSRNILEYIDKAARLRSTIMDRNFEKSYQYCYHERGRSRMLHHQLVIYNGHFHKFRQLRKRLDTFQTNVADIDVHIWYANNNRSSLKFLQRTVRPASELKERLRRISSELKNIGNIEDNLYALKRLKKTFLQRISHDKHHISQLASKIPILRKHLAKYKGMLNLYKNDLASKMKNFDERPMELYIFYNRKPQQILDNISQRVKLIYLSREMANEAESKISKARSLLLKYIDENTRLLRGHPVEVPSKLIQTTENSDIIFNKNDDDLLESSGLSDETNDDDDDNEVDYQNSDFLTDQVFLDNSYKNISLFSPDIRKNDQLLTRNIQIAPFQNLHVDFSSDLRHQINVISDLETSVKFQKRTVTAIEETCELVRKNLTFHLNSFDNYKRRLENSIPSTLRLINDVALKMSKNVRVYDMVEISKELRNKYGKTDLLVHRNNKTILKLVEKTIQSLKMITLPKKLAPILMPVKSDVFSKLAADLREKIANAKKKAAKLQGPIHFHPPGFIKPTLPISVAAMHSYLTTIDISFNSANDDAVILQIGNSSQALGTSIFIYLNDSFLIMSIKQNGHVWNGKHPTRITLNKWYRIELEWVCSKLKVMLTAAHGKAQLYEGELLWPCDIERIFIPSVWIGGINRKSDVEKNSIYDIDGCIGGFKINGAAVSLHSWESSMGRQSLCSLATGHRSHETTSLNLKGNVFEVDSSKLDITFPPSITFSFRSTQRNATILFLLDSKQEAWMEMKLISGKIVVEFWYGPKKIIMLSSQLEYNDGQLCHVNLNITGREILKRLSLVINNVDRQSGSLYVPDKRKSIIYVGGLPNNTYAPSSKLIGKDTKNQRFVGCMLGLKINNKSVTPGNHSEYMEFAMETCPVIMAKCMCLTRKSKTIRIGPLGYYIDMFGIYFSMNAFDTNIKRTILYYTSASKNWLEIFTIDQGVWVEWKVDSGFQSETWRGKLIDLRNSTWHIILLQNYLRNANRSTLHVDETNIELPHRMFSDVRYASQNTLYLGGKSLRIGQPFNICYNNMFLNDEMKDFSNFAIPNTLSDCPNRDYVVSVIS